MTPEERALIDGLFDRMRGVENQPRDAEAEALIARRTSEAPHATYTLAQTVLVQEHALQQAAARIQELEAQAQAAQAQQPAPSFLGGLFGGGAPRGTSVPTSGARSTGPMGLPQGYNAQQPGYGPQAGAQPSGPWGQQPQYQQPQYQPQRPGMFGGGGGGFLSGALTTAAGVAGGALLFEGIKGLMSGGTGPIAQQASSLLEQPAAAAGDLASQAQEALGGAPDTNVAAADTGNDPWSSGASDTGYQDAGYDDGGDFGGDDSNWA
ncbi:DUF2076 domain-containing protein [Azorhizobium doebereinerae]|uniref:DUF2076 domain-containing protein n=1 Tax=Azorhizobium doebereinerae TaxID=281091 RepID=UPI0003F83EA9|nr:DUF2076 domain-containing protein [Azorhizobium doebereinerae]